MTRRLHANAAAKQLAFRIRHAPSEIRDITDSDAKAIANLAANAAGRPMPNPGLRIQDLSSLLQQMVGAHVRGLIAVRDMWPRINQPTDDECYLMAIENFGITCPHPRADKAGCLVCGSRLVRS